MQVAGSNHQLIVCSQIRYGSPKITLCFIIVLFHILPILPFLTKYGIHIVLHVDYTTIRIRCRRQVRLLFFCLFRVYVNMELLS